MSRTAAFLMAALLGGTAVLLLWLGPDDERFAHAPDAERSGQNVSQPADAAPPAADGAPPEVRAAAREWPLAHHDYANTRATTTSSIDSRTVGDLGIGWRRDLVAHSHWGAAASAPLIANGVVYFQDLRSDVWALDLATGATRWKHVLKQPAFGPNGPAIGWGKVYAQDGIDSLRALDLRTGRQLWRSELSGATGANQPVAYNGFVYTAIAAGRVRRLPTDKEHLRLLVPGSSGFAYGARAEDGRLSWRFRTVTKGFWGRPDVNAGGGIWFPPAVDTRTGTTFWSTGNPAPAPGTKDYPNASSRPGPNLYTNTLLALDGRTGRKLWHNQLKPHDIFHHDLQNSPILVTAAGRRLVIASGKGGRVFALDRETGERIWEAVVGIHRNDTLRKLPADDRPIVVYPGFWGGIETPGAFDGKTLYFLTENLPTPYTSTAWRSDDGAQSVQNHEGRTPLDKGTSELVALDAATGHERWSHRFDQIGFGGATVVNDLVFTATYDGTVYALRRGDGSVAWRGNVGAGIIAWPAVAGDTLVWPAGLGRDPELVALRLGGHEKAVEPRTRDKAGER
jgi:outer membrane protein assembly factor BamB